MTEWSEDFSSVDFGDLQASAMAVDCLGKWAVLAGRRFLTMVDLDEPLEKSHRLTRQSKWDISCVQWNPHASHAQLFATATTQRLDVSTWEEASIKQLSSMKAHSRNISDIDWSPFDVNVIASCSVDTFTYLWDIRDPKRPAASFQSVCGVSQVKWNKVTNNLFATAHEGDVRIWDPRKGNTPVVYLTAHLSKIHGLDWSPVNEHTFATSSQECTVKFWDYTNPRQTKGMLNSGSPVWRARFTPFGEGLVTVVLPTLRRGENSLYLWNVNTLDQPVHQFVGHSDVVVEFQWRKKQEASRDYHLVTWSRDQNLKIWKVDPSLQRSCGHDTLDSSENDSATLLDIPDAGQPFGEVNGHADKGGDSNMPNDENLPPRQMTLYQEFSLLNKYIPNVNIEMTDGTQRQCTVSVGSSNYNVLLTITFPAEYPNGAPPRFDISYRSNVASWIIKKLNKVLVETAQTHVKRNMNCLEICIRQFASAFESMTMEERKTPDSDTFPPTTKLQHSFNQLPFANFQDFSIPFMRTCGAQFNSVGLLVQFGRSREANMASEKTPKALSELAAYTSTSRVRSSQSSSGFTTMFSRSPPSSKAEPLSISMFYMPKQQRQRTKSRTLKEFQELKFKNNDKSVKKEKKTTVKLDPVRIYDVHSLLTIHKELGEKYSLDTSNMEEMCHRNRIEAAAVGRGDLVRIWSMVAIMSSPALKPSCNPDDGPPWATHPFGRPLLESLMKHCWSIHDVQTLAMLCCIFTDRQYAASRTTTPQASSQNMKKSASKSSLDYVPANYNPYHTVSSMSGLLRSLTKAIQEQAVPEEKAAPAVTMSSTPPSTTSHPAEVTSPKISDLLSRAMVKIRRSNSLTDFSFEDYRFAEETKDRAEDVEKQQHESLCRMLDPTKYSQYDHCLRVYADILYRWGFRNQSAYILKHVSVPPEPHSGIEFGVQCHHCGTDVPGLKCSNCKKQAFVCIICHKGVRGASNFCLNCGHGGHAGHIREWFKLEDQCPTGCGCLCLQYSLV